MSVRTILILALQWDTCQPKMYIQAIGIKSSFKAHRLKMDLPLQPLETGKCQSILHHPLPLLLPEPSPAPVSCSCPSLMPLPSPAASVPAIPSPATATALPMGCYDGGSFISSGKKQQGLAAAPPQLQLFQWGKDL